MPSNGVQIKIWSASDVDQENKGTGKEEKKKKNEQAEKQITSKNLQMLTQLIDQTSVTNCLGRVPVGFSLVVVVVR